MNSSVVLQPTRTDSSFLFLCLGLVVLSLAFVLLVAPQQGWDTRIFCAAARAASDGRDPYDVSQLGLLLSWNYQPYMLTLFGAVCRFPLRFESSYPFVYIFFLGVGLALLKPAPASRLLALTLALGSFWAFGWTLFTGNITALEFLLIAGVFALLVSQLWEAAALVLGLLASIKLVTVAYLILLLFVPLPGARKWRVFLVSVAAFAFTFGVSYLLYPNLMQSFVEQGLGLMPNQHNALTETGEMNNIPLAYFPMETLALVGVPLSGAILALVGFALSTAVVFFIFGKLQVRELAQNNYVAFFSLGLIALTLILPRLKPYSFLMLVPALFYLLRSQGLKRQNLVVLLTVVVPTVFFFIRLFVATSNELVSLLVTYSSTILLLVTLVVLVYYVNHPEEVAYGRTS